MKLYFYVMFVLIYIRYFEPKNSTSSYFNLTFFCWTCIIIQEGMSDRPSSLVEPKTSGKIHINTTYVFL